MQLTLSLSTASASLAILSTFSFTTAVPTNDKATAVDKRQNIPHHINIGLNDKRYNSDTGKSMWTAWVNGADPCHKHTDLEVYEGSDSPCNIRFALPDEDYQYSMQGCGGDLWLMRNGKDNVGTCYWAPGHVGCVAGAGYTGRWQCQINDATD
ncbi:hypothetical protein GQ43DRAFT_444089 [Delitschia confertaspora ATCC 74209]|uniref:Uncharacterized protein n=1 Tax=Delitschia confertaspora ATCC 74209 TaxID=1513339 RepID=A0A9P4MS37_9PLEO|nr:hypothetical protein GQ43DRAFT_444089 [Delitschia confertaspora ATCC 74209]